MKKISSKAFDATVIMAEIIFEFFMLYIVFESHATSVDNEAKMASGIIDVSLSDLGKEQARQLGERYKDERFAAIFCSKLQRSRQTAEIAFAGKAIPIIADARLNECNYGRMNGASVLIIEKERQDRIHLPFPEGESYIQTTEKMKSFLQQCQQEYAGKKIMLIGHRATQYGLEHIVNGISLEKVVTATWKWQPGWSYLLQ